MAQLTIQQTFDLALQHHQAGRLQEAEPLYAQILARQPENLGALRNLALIAHQSGRDGMAVDLIRRAIAVTPNDAVIHSDLGIALKQAGQLDEAIAAYRYSIALNPGNADVHNNLGNALKQKGWLDKAIEAYRQAIALRPDFAGAHHNLGFALGDKGQFEESIAAYRQAIHFKPKYAEAHNNLGMALKKVGRLDEAVAAFRGAIAVNFNTPEAHNNLGNALKHKGQLDEAIAAYRQAAALDPGNALIDSNLLSILLFHPGYDAPAIAEENRRWARQHAEPLRKFIQDHSNDPSPDRRLRIGYVSPDFRNHVVARNLMPVFDCHDRARFEITCYSCVQAPDAMTSQFQQKADVWRDIAGLGDERAAEQIREDRIDILVDLALHLADNRLLVFARKPAPVQVTFAGYPGSTGLETIDYRLTDPHLDPPGLNDEFYSEKSYRLPHTFWCFDPRGDEVAVGALPAQTNGHVTFGCLNNFCKITEPVLQLWARVLKMADRSRILILCPEGNHRQRVLDVMRREGVNPDRVELVSHRPRVQYLKIYNRIDVGLDSFPYNGHSTSLDSLWMGVPVVTLVGKTVVGRAGLSQLNNLGLTELIARTPEEYVRIASELAGDLPRLAELRRTLRPRMEASGLMDAAGFTRGIEAAYREMWRAWCAGQSV
jgi:protein O-GlcNAc transferase